VAGTENYPRFGAGRRLLVASNNSHKVEELRRMLEPLGLDLVVPANRGLTLDVEETGASFAENALLKAHAFSAASGLPAVADDSGLVVDALGGEPGIYSARYGGSGLTDMDRCRLVLEKLGDVPWERRSARFVSAIALVEPEGNALEVAGHVDGVIALEARGTGGFGYDPIFYFPPAGKTFGEMSARDKDAVSHRSVALRRVAEALSGPRNPGILQ
jgi:XTP/dITP diphosphohydrolase